MAGVALVSAAESAVTLRLTALRQMVEQEGVHGVVALWPEQVTATLQDLAAVLREIIPLAALAALTGAMAVTVMVMGPVTARQALAAAVAVKKVTPALVVMAVMATLPAVLAGKAVKLIGMALTQTVLRQLMGITITRAVVAVAAQALAAPPVMVAAVTVTVIRVEPILVAVAAAKAIAAVINLAVAAQAAQAL